MFVKLLLFTLMCLAVSKVYCSVKPRFKYDLSKCQTLLSNRRTWYAGCPNSIAVLSSSRYDFVILHIEMEGDFSYMDLKMIITCPWTKSSKQLSLNKERTTPATFCEAEKTPVTVQHDSWYTEHINRHVYKLSLENHHSLSDILKNSVRISVTATVRSNERFLDPITSNYLDIYNLQPVDSFLTNEAFSFFRKMPYEQSTASFPSIQFIDPMYIRLLNRNIHGTFFESLLEIGGVLDVASTSCSFEILKELMISSSASNLNLRRSGQIYYYLDFKTGVLTFSRSGVARFTHKLVQETIDKRSSVCSYVSLGSVTASRRLVEANSAYPPYNYKNIPSRFTCHKVSVTDYEKVILYSGLSGSSIKCPIVCDYDTPIKFTHNGKVLYSNSQSLDEPFVIQNSLVFPEILTPRHSGIYTCRYGQSSLKHEFHVSVKALPTFVKPDGALPHTIFAMEGEPLSFSCTVFDIDTMDEFKAEICLLDIERGSPCLPSIFLFKLKSEFDKSNGMTRLIHKRSKIPPLRTSPGLKLTYFRFNCVARAWNKNLRPLKMDEYSVRSGADVHYIPIPTHDDFVAPSYSDSFVQRQNIHSGATFKFSLKPAFADYLKLVGVSVSGYFKLDDINVKDLVAFKRNHVRFNPDADFLLELTIPPITDDNKDLLDELQKRKTLTAVYNFNYNYMIPSNLVLDKSRYGRARVGDEDDCRSKSSCFYSTEFPAILDDRSLSFLTVDINFMDI